MSTDAAGVMVVGHCWRIVIVRWDLVIDRMRNTAGMSSAVMVSMSRKA